MDEMRAPARASVPSTDGRSDGLAARWWCRIPMERKSIRGRAYLGDGGGGGGGANRRRAARGDVDAPRADAARRRVRREDARSERGVRRRHRCGQPKVKPSLAAGAGIGSLAIRRVLRTRSRLMCDRSSAFHVAPSVTAVMVARPKKKIEQTGCHTIPRPPELVWPRRTPHPRQGRSPLRDTTLVARASRRGVASVTRAITTRGVSRAPRPSLPPAPFQDARASSIARARRVRSPRVTRSAILQQPRSGDGNGVPRDCSAI